MAVARARPIAVALLLVVVSISTHFSLPTESHAGGARFSFRRSERCLMKKINAIRSRRGLGQLNWDKQLAYVARTHSGRMASRRAIYHDYDLGSKVTRWYRLGQNTGTAGGCRAVMRAFMNSSKHRANILGRWRHMGVGATRSGGRVWVQQVFESRRDPGNVYSYP